MDQVGALLNQPSASSAKSSPRCTNQRRKVTIEIFGIFQELFPRDWALSIDGIEASMIERWSKSLGDYTPDDIKRGVLACEDLISPPSLGKFKQLCRPPSPTQNARAYRQHDLLSVDRLKAQTITAKAEKRLMRLIMKQPVEDFDSETEIKIESYCAARQPRRDDSAAVVEFLAAYRGGENP